MKMLLIALLSISSLAHAGGAVVYKMDGIYQYAQRYLKGYAPEISHESAVTDLNKALNLKKVKSKLTLDTHVAVNLLEIRQKKGLTEFDLSAIHETLEAVTGSRNPVGFTIERIRIPGTVEGQEIRIYATTSPDNLKAFAAVLDAVTEWALELERGYNWK